MVWTNPDYILSHVETLPPWGEHLHNDPNWVLEAAEFGWVPPCKTPAEFEAFMTLGGPIEVSKLSVIVIDPTYAFYSCQNLIRLDAVAHYLNHVDLFDQEGHWGNDYPVVSEWKDGYVVFDGNHRLTADKLMGRLSYVLFHPSS